MKSLCYLWLFLLQALFIFTFLIHFSLIQSINISSKLSLLYLKWLSNDANATSKAGFEKQPSL